MGGGQAKQVGKTEHMSKRVASTKKLSGVKKKNSMLMLGTAGVGKTTIVKQLTMQLGDGLTEEKKIELRHALRLGCMKRIMDIVNWSAEEHDDEPGQEKLVIGDDCDWLYEKVEELGMFNMDTATPEAIATLGDDLAKMWANPLVQEIAKTREIENDNDVCLMHACADKFLPEVQRIFAAATALTNAEALQVRSPTSSIEITPFVYGDENWAVKDVGGQIHHRAAWKSAFGGTSVVLYIVSLADYDKFTGPDMKKNLLMESRKLFKEVAQNDEMLGKPFVLLFNKEDLFVQKLEKKNFSICPQFRTTNKQNLEKQPDETYVEYKDRCNEALFKYYEKAYREVLVANHVIKEGAKAPIEFYSTCATDEAFVENSFNTIFTSIVKAISAQVQNSGLA